MKVVSQPQFLRGCGSFRESIPQISLLQNDSCNFFSNMSHTHTHTHTHSFPSSWRCVWIFAHLLTSHPFFADFFLVSQFHLIEIWNMKRRLQALLRSCFLKWRRLTLETHCVYAPNEGVWFPLLYYFTQRKMPRNFTSHSTFSVEQQMEHTSSWSGVASINTVSRTLVHAKTQHHQPFKRLGPQTIPSSRVAPLFLHMGWLKIDSNSTLYTGWALLFPAHQSVKVTTFANILESTSLTFLPGHPTKNKKTCKKTSNLKISMKTS